MSGETGGNRSNPFATRWIRPGALEYLFPPGESAGELLGRLRAAGWRGQIVGPHGTGKSTLVAMLLPALEAAGRRGMLFTLHNGQRRLPGGWHLACADARPGVIVVDGYEQLGLPARLLLKRYCRRSGWGLLATAHSSVGLPTVYETRADLELARRVVQQLVGPADAEIDAAAVAQAFTDSGGNVREMLFALYDVYRRQAARNATSC